MKRSALITAVIALCTLVACAEEPAPAPEQPIRITLVEILTAESFPLQLLVHVQGEPPAQGCWSYPEAPVPEIAGNVITLTITSRLEVATCAAAPWRYDTTVNLGSDFSTGEYLLRVNGVEQSFHFDSGFGP